LAPDERELATGTQTSVSLFLVAETLRSEKAATIRNDLNVGEFALASI